MFYQIIEKKNKRLYNGQFEKNNQNISIKNYCQKGYFTIIFRYK